MALVVRRESDGLRRYVHLGTGNYNASTARVYEDFALLTCRADIGEDATNLFNALTGFARGISYRKLLVAPGALRAGLVSRIEREIAPHRTRLAHGRLIFKINALVDPAIIQALYRASQAGVQIDLVVRGMCSPASRPSRRQREYSRGEPGRAHPGAQPHLLLRQRRRRSRKRC